MGQETKPLFLKDDHPLTAGTIARLLHRLIYMAYCQSVWPTTYMIYRGNPVVLQLSASRSLVDSRGVISAERRELNHLSPKDNHPLVAGIIAGRLLSLLHTALYCLRPTKALVPTQCPVVVQQSA